MELDDAARRLEALGHPTRLAIFRMLVRAGPEGLAVNAIQRDLGIPGSTLSHHLSRLMSVGLMGQQRHGATLICRANYAVMDGLIGFLTEECCADARHDAA